MRVERGSHRDLVSPRERVCPQFSRLLIGQSRFVGVGGIHMGSISSARVVIASLGVSVSLTVGCGQHPRVRLSATRESGSRGQLFLLDEGPSYFENDEVGVPQLYFSSSRLMSLGGPGSIFVSEQAADGSFGPAVLVPELTSGLGNTRRPSIRHDGLEIFFGFRACRQNSQQPGPVGGDEGNRIRRMVSTGQPGLAFFNSELVDVQPYISSDLGNTLLCL